MNILSEQEFSITPGSTNYSNVILNGKKMDSTIEGCYLELCVKSDDQYMVFMTDDIPNEDILRIHLLDEKLNVIDSANIGSIYSTGSFKNPVVEGKNKVSFDFIGDTRWSVELLKEKEFKLPFISSPKGVSRKHIFNQSFRVYGDPHPES